MKKSILPIICLTLFGVTNVFGQEKAVRTLEAFGKVDISGNIEVNLVRSAQPSIEIEVRNGGHMDEYVTEVRNGKLFVHHAKEYLNQNEPKVFITLMHTGIDDYDFNGIVKLFSEDVLERPELTIYGSGMISGEIPISVQDLHIGLSGISNLTISGKANNAELNVDGMGKINAKKMAVNKMQKNSGGFATVKLADN